MEELRDIQGLQPISWWPLAWGWWVVIAVVCCTLAAVIVWQYKKYKYRRSWQGKAYANLLKLENELQIADLKDVLQQLSAEIRQIAINKSSRSSCAGLSARRWLQWLQDNDPQSYSWTSKGALLITDQYSPAPNTGVEQIQEIINAMKIWVQK